MSVIEHLMLISMLSNLAKMLHELYAKEEKWKPANGSLSSVYVMEKFYLVEKCGVEYVKFLKERGKVGKALKQCRWVQRVLVVEF